MPDRCPKQHKLDRRLFEAPWRTKAPQVPMLFEPVAPSSTRHVPVVVQASARTKASLVLMVFETSAARSTRLPYTWLAHLHIETFLDAPRCLG